MLGVSLLLFLVSQGRQKAWKIGAGLGATSCLCLVLAVLDVANACCTEVKQKLPWSWVNWRQSLILKLMSCQ